MKVHYADTRVYLPQGTVFDCGLNVLDAVATPYGVAIIVEPFADEVVSRNVVGVDNSGSLKWIIEAIPGLSALSHYTQFVEDESALRAHNYAGYLVTIESSTGKLLDWEPTW